MQWPILVSYVKSALYSNSLSNQEGDDNDMETATGMKK